MNRPAEFHDSVYGSWTCQPGNVLIGKHQHPKRAAVEASLRNRHSEEHVKFLIKKKHGEDVTVDYSTYVNNKIKAKFFDKQFGEFWRAPQDVFKGKRHPTYGYKKCIQNNTRYYVGEESLTKFAQTIGASHSHVCKLARRAGVATALEYLKSNLDDAGKLVRRVTNVEAEFISIVRSLLPGVSFWGKEPLESKISFRPDFRLVNSDRVIYVDVHGLYIHSNKMNFPKKAHREKFAKFCAANLTYLQFFEDELVDHPDIIRSIVAAKLGLISTKKFARKLLVKDVPAAEAKDFFAKTHLMGSTKCRTIGLYENDNLVCALGYRILSDYVDLTRFSTALNTSCVGGFGRLVSYLKQFKKPIVSFCDLRYADGHSYEKLGFKNVGETLGWSWTDGEHRFNRRQCRAGNGSTELENAALRNWFKIYDAGQRKYRLEV